MDKLPPAMMNKKQAEIYAKHLTPEQKKALPEFMRKLNAGELQLTDVFVDDNEQIQRIILEPKNKAGAPDKPFYKHFKPIITGVK